MALSWVERNPILDVEFAGLRSDTCTLGRCGWKLAIEAGVNHYRDMRLVILHHPFLGVTLTGRIELPTFAQFRDPQEARQHMPPVRLERCVMKGHGTVYLQGALPKVEWVETAPTLMEVSRSDLFALPIFAALNAPDPAAEQLIVEPATVSELLDQIRRMQAPEQAAIRERERRRERSTTPRLHAQILSLAA